MNSRLSLTEKIDRALSLLGLTGPATLEDAKRAYRRASRECHPDRGGDADRFKEVSEAWKVLEHRFQTLPDGVRLEASRAPTPTPDAPRGTPRSQATRSRRGESAGKDDAAPRAPASRATEYWPAWLGEPPAIGAHGAERGWDRDAVPDGHYTAEVVDLGWSRARKNATLMLRWQLRILEGPWAGRRLLRQVAVSPRSERFLRNDLCMAGYLPRSGPPELRALRGAHLVVAARSTPDGRGYLWQTVDFIRPAPRPRSSARRAGPRGVVEAGGRPAPAAVGARSRAERLGERSAS